MLRFSLLLAVAVLAAGATGCTHCDTCDDFPVPCVGHNTGVPFPPAESYTMNVGADHATIVSNPAKPASSSNDAGRPVAPTGPGPFKPSGTTSASTTSSPTLEALPSGGDVTPPAPSSLGSAKAN